MQFDPKTRVKPPAPSERSPVMNLLIGSLIVLIVAFAGILYHFMSAPPRPCPASSSLHISHYFLRIVTI